MSKVWTSVVILSSVILLHYTWIHSCHSYSLRARRSYRISLNQLFAKKKSGKLVSDDLLTILDSEEVKSTAGDGIININELDDQKSKSKLKKSLDKEPNSSPDDVAEVSDKINSKKSNKDKKNQKKFGFDLELLKSDEIDVSVSDSIEPKVDSVTPGLSDAVISSDDTLPIDGGTIEQQVRKDRPPARVRFAESSQPNFVMMALEKVGLVFGNHEVLKNASFSVATGERLGLVGQNGGGKVLWL